MDGYDIAEILYQAGQIAEADGYESFPTTMFYSEEMKYIQEALEQYGIKKVLIKKLLDAANGDDVFANLDNCTIDELQTLWDGYTEGLQEMA